MNKVKTGIPGFDEIVDGGFPENRVIFLQGEPGTGKSTFATQFLVNGAEKYQENGLLISFEYAPSFYIADMHSFNWPLKNLIKTGNLSIVTPKGGLENQVELTLDSLINFIFDEANKINAKRVVIDSINSLEIIFSKSQNIRKEIIRFTSLISELGCTSLLISEMAENNQMYNYMAHGVVNFYYSKVGAHRFRGIEVSKLRGSSHSSYTHSLQIREGSGVEVLPTEMDISS